MRIWGGCECDQKEKDANFSGFVNVTYELEKSLMSVRVTISYLIPTPS